MKELIGKKITGIFVNEYQSELIFNTDQGLIGYYTLTDCCDETWFADIIGVSALLGGVVQSSEEVPMVEISDNRTRQEIDKIYGIKIKTDKGYVDIIFRNSSNGYYNGSIELFIPEEAILFDKMTAITDDWHA